MWKSRSSFALYPASILLGLLVWEAVAMFVPRGLLPPPSAVLGRLAAMTADGSLPRALAGSVQHMIVGYLLAVAAAIPLGILIGRNAPVATAVEPVLNAIYAIPPVALVPFFVIWFGMYFEGRVALVFAMCFFEILINVMQGARNVDRGLVDAARSLEASGLALWRRVLIPASLPFIFTGLRVGIGRAVNAMITAELFFVAVNLGQMLKTRSNAFDTASAFALILVVSLFGLACQEGMRLIERRAIPWHRGSEA
jgi:ABC-type nitrate/sulfonate/bicarbonate transport system permease component